MADIYDLECLNEPNEHHRIYDREVADQIIDAVKCRNEGRVFGQINHPKIIKSKDTWNLEGISLNEISHYCSNLGIREEPNGKQYLTAEVTILDTEAGELLKYMISSGIEITFRLAGWFMSDKANIEADEGVTVRAFVVHSINAIVLQS